MPSPQSDNPVLIVWTVVPEGVACTNVDGCPHLKLSVVISPRIKATADASPEEQSSINEVFGEWTSNVKRYLQKLIVTFDNSTSSGPKSLALSVDTAMLSVAAWGKVFKTQPYSKVIMDHKEAYITKADQPITKVSAVSENAIWQDLLVVYRKRFNSAITAARLQNTHGKVTAAALSAKLQSQVQKLNEWRTGIRSNFGGSHWQEFNRLLRRNTPRKYDPLAPHQLTVQFGVFPPDPKSGFPGDQYLLLGKYQPNLQPILFEKQGPGNGWKPYTIEELKRSPKAVGSLGGQWRFLEFNDDRDIGGPNDLVVQDNVIFKRIGQSQVAMETFGWNEKLASLANYPHLQRRLGLVFDLVIPLPSQDVALSSIKDADIVCVSPQWDSQAWPSAPTGPLSPRTKIRIEVAGECPTNFYAVAGNGEPNGNGLLKIGGASSYMLKTIELIGTGMKAYNQAKDEPGNMGAHFVTIFENNGKHIVQLIQNDQEAFDGINVGFVPGQSLLDWVVNVSDVTQTLNDLAFVAKWKGSTSITIAFQTQAGTQDVVVRFQALCVRAPEGSLIGILWQAVAKSTKPYGKDQPGDWVTLTGNASRSDLEVVLSAAHSAGISLLDTNREVSTSVKRGNQLKLRDETDDTKIILYAEDLIQGYIPDIGALDLDGNRRWLSLCQRVENYETILSEFTEDKAVRSEAFVRSTGIVQNAPSTPTGLDQIPPPIGLKVVHASLMTQPVAAPAAQNKSANQELFISQSYFTYEGSSLAISDKSPKVAYDTDLPKKHQTVTLEDGSEWQLGIPVTLPPKTLPPLRFVKPGATKPDEEYLVRIRTVDIAGYSMGELDPEKRLAKADKLINEMGDQATNVFLGTGFYRYEPVHPPSVLISRKTVFRNWPSSDGLMQMVIRDGDGEDVRYLIPPRVSFDMAKRLRCFDRQCMRDKPIDLSDIGSFTGVRLDKKGAIISVGDLYPSLKDASFGSLPMFASYRKRCKATPYYPDPFCRVCLCRFTDSEGGVIERMFQWYPDNDSWPIASPVRIILKPSNKDSETKVRWHSGERALLISLPKGWTGTLELSSGFGNSSDHDDGILGEQILNCMAWWNHAKQPGITFDSQDIALSVKGANPVLSPSIIINCIHACQSPLKPPILPKPIIILGEGPGNPDPLHSPSANPEAQIQFPTLQIDTKSCAKVQFLAHWDDVVEDLQSDTGFRTSKSSSPVWDLPIDTPVSVKPTEVNVTMTHHLPDTRYRVINYEAIGRTRFACFYKSVTERNKTGQR